MRGSSTEMLKILIPLAALLFGSQAIANPGPYKEVRGWSLFRNPTNCSAYMMFENHEAVGFAYDAAARSTRISFSDASATALEDGDSSSIDILLRRPDGTVDHAWAATTFLVSVGEDGRRTLSSRWLGPPALDDFRQAAFVGFFDKEREIGVFSLRGTAAALQEVVQCSMQVSTTEPKDSSAR